MRPGIVLFFVAFLVPALLSAGTTGKLAGKVTDRQTGEPLVGAIVQIRSLGTGAATDAEGYYYLINLPPGSYEVTTSYVGYARLTERAVIINVDRTTTLNLGMNAEAIQSQAVVVEAERMPIQRDQSSTIQSVDANDLRVLPVNTISGVLQLQTGVVSSGGDLHVRGNRITDVRRA